MTKFLIFVFSAYSFSSCSAPTADRTIEGQWEGEISDPTIFNFDIKLANIKSSDALLTISNSDAFFKKTLQPVDQAEVNIDIDDRTQMHLRFTKNKQKLIGFIKSGILMYHISLEKDREGNFAGSWKPFIVDRLQPQSIYLSVERNEGDLVAYPFFGDRRFTGTWASDFTSKGDTILFRDYKTGLKFKATYSQNKIQLDILFSNVTMAKANLFRSANEWKFGINSDQNSTSGIPAQLNDGWITSNIDSTAMNKDLLIKMIDDVHNNTLENTNSILIAKNDTLIFESYFDEFNADIPHDQRSGSKSISSAIIGIAIADGFIKGVDQKLYDCIPNEYQYTNDSLKDLITIHDLLTMSAGMDVGGKASEGTYQDTDNWLKTTLEAPMKHTPGTYTDYGSANPFLLSVCLNERLDLPLELYMDEKLLHPLGISNYIIQTDHTGRTPYFGGGMYLTPRDMLKFGQLYLNQGTWNGKQIIPKGWVEQSFKKHTRLEDVKDKNEYGYQWWHRTYTVKGNEFKSIEARGAGGQYIFVIPELVTVVVVTSGNFRNGKLLQQPEKILESYILPALTK